MQVIAWETSIAADWKRALDLRNLHFSNGCLRIEVEEESGKLWFLEFKSVQAYKVTTEECAGKIISKLPTKGGLFIIEQSLWLGELGSSHLMEKSKHFVICCYDEILEILAWDCSVTPKL